MIYLSIDPGKATGIATLELGDGEPRFTSYILEGPRLHQIREIETLINFNPVEVCIQERFDIRPDTHKKTNQEDARYIIGAVEWICFAADVPYIEQTPAQMKRFANKPREFAKVRALGWHKTGEGHDNDAAGHLITFLSTDKSPAGDWLRARLIEVL